MNKNSRLTTGKISLRIEVRPLVESLESKTLLSAAPRLAAFATTAGQISGQVTNSETGKGIGPIRLQLIDETGTVVKTTLSGPAGRYAFKVATPAPYVVREVVPRRFVQTSPRFSTAAPVGSYGIDPATGKAYTSASWNYTTGNDDPANGPVGPAFWSTIAPAGNLPFQSPIGLTTAPIDLSPYLSINYQSAVPKAIVNNGSQIQAQFDTSSADTITLDGAVSDLAQFHFHDPSESQVDGKPYPMEAHFVNVSASGALTVVAVFLQIGATNPSLQPILDAATQHLTRSGSSFTPTTAVDLAGLLPTSLEGWFYEGSLTTPPLAQVVNWLVLSTPITLSYAQLQQYEAVASGAGFLPNALSVRPLDGRQVDEFNIDVNFEGPSVADADFAIAPRTTASISTSSIRSTWHQVTATSPPTLVANPSAESDFTAPSSIYLAD